MSVIKNGVVHLVGDGTWKFLDPFIDGEDIVVRGVHGTRWGSKSDKMDGGVTASGVDIHSMPLARFCALPMDVGPSCPSTQGSPLPKMEWGQPVRVFFHKTGKTVSTALMDLGPGKRTKHAIDLTDAVWLAGGVDLADGVTLVDYRIIGGAKYVKG